jgi:GntR family transcriptional repressor for pyruvate dehydrogenase complex
MEDSSRLSQAVVERIRELILRGELRDGDKLPSERSLVEELGLSRSSVREALRILEAMQLIKVLPREGAYVEASAEMRAVLDTCITWLLENQDAIIEILDARAALDEKAAELVNHHEAQQPGYAAPIEQCINEMEAALEAEDLDKIVEADICFHLSIANLSRNGFLFHLSELLTPLFGESRKILFSLPGRAAKSIGEHRTILEAIQSNDPALARQAVRAHTESVKASFVRLNKQVE